MSRKTLELGFLMRNVNAGMLLGWSKLFLGPRHEAAPLGHK